MVAQIDLKFMRARPSKIWARLLAYLLFEGRPLTTRGRWINPIVFAGYRVWSYIPFKHRAQMPIFILGTGRSGTSVLGAILALHRQVGFLNEPKALWHAALGDDDLIGSYTLRPASFKMSAQNATSGVIQRLHRSYAAFLRFSGCQRVVDKYPELIFRTEMIDAVFPEARKIVLVRNGLDTCQSIENWSKRNATSSQSDSVDWWGRNRRKWDFLVEELVVPDPIFAGTIDEIRQFTRQTDMAAVEWIVTMNEALRLQSLAYKNTIFVRYEDLASNPRTTTDRIAKFCELERDDKMLDYAQNTLVQAKPYPSITLHPAIQEPFNATMKALGYRAEPAT